LASRYAGITPAGQKISEASAHHSFSFAALMSAMTIPTKPKAPTPANTESASSSESVTHELKPTSSTPAAQPAMIIASIDLRPSFDQYTSLSSTQRANSSSARPMPIAKKTLTISHQGDAGWWTTPT